MASVNRELACTKTIFNKAIQWRMTKEKEILNLLWEDVDFDRGQILVRTSKNGEPRHVEMNGLLAETLRQMQRRPQNPYVFGSRDGNPYNDIRKSFKSALAAAGIAEFRFHDLRHTFASHLVMNGVDLMTVKELLGHKTIQMTLRYSHLSQGHKKKAVETLGCILDGHFLDTKAENGVGVLTGQVCKSAI